MFTGVHSKKAILGHSHSARIEIQDAGVDTWNDVYDAKVFATGPDGREYTKSGNNGVSTFFPDSWSEQKIKDEVVICDKKQPRTITKYSERI